MLRLLSLCVLGFRFKWKLRLHLLRHSRVLRHTHHSIFSEKVSSVVISGYSVPQGPFCSFWYLWEGGITIPSFLYLARIWSCPLNNCIITIILHVCVYTYATVCLWRSEDNFGVGSLLPCGSEDQTHVIRVLWQVPLSTGSHCWPWSDP